jgi:hypothetical protein
LDKLVGLTELTALPNLIYPTNSINQINRGVRLSTVAFG